MQADYRPATDEHPRVLTDRRQERMKVWVSIANGTHKAPWVEERCHLAEKPLSIRIAFPSLSLTLTTSLPRGVMIAGAIGNSHTPGAVLLNREARFVPAGMPFAAKSAITSRLFSLRPA